MGKRRFSLSALPQAVEIVGKDSMRYEDRKKGRNVAIAIENQHNLCYTKFIQAKYSAFDMS